MTDRITVSGLHLPGVHLSRRRFLALAGGLVATGCSIRSDGSTLGTDAAPTSTSSTETPAGTADAATPSTTPPATAPGTVTTVTVPPEVVPDDRVLVVVQLDGGNDAVNTLVPDLGSYRDLRPGLALAEDELLRVGGIDGHAFHSSLAPLVPHLEAGRIATIAGVGFDDPDRSHFTSIDRWDRADMMDASLGWLGRWLDTLDADLPALGATALGGNGAILTGQHRRASVIQDVDAFAFPRGVSNADIRALAAEASADPLMAAAQEAFLASVGAVEEFDAIADAVRDNTAGSDGGDFAPVSGPFSNGLAVAAELIRSDVGTRIVSVTGNGFDTHSEQLDLHAQLLDDVAGGLADFWESLDASGDSGRVLVLTTSEFGRRVPENGSAGCDHGAAGLSFLMGDGVDGGLYGSIDTDELVEDDLRPIIDPRTMFTACLDWLGADVEAVLGGRHDDVTYLT